MSTAIPAPPHPTAASASHGLPAWLRWCILLLSCLLLGWADYVTGWEVSMFVFYALPILLAVWWFGRNAAFATATLCAYIWWRANQDGNPYETTYGYAVAMLNRFIYFLVVALAANAVRKRQASDAASIRMLEHQRELEQEIITVSEREQQRIGQDLHDGLCQQLAAIGCAARALADDLTAQHLPEARDAELIETTLRHAVIEARNLARGISPAHLENDGLLPALNELVQNTALLTGLPIDLNAPTELPPLDLPTSRHFYRIAQQAVANSLQHSGGKSIHLTLITQTPGELELTIADDGQGMPFALPHKSPGMGLRIMRYRAAAMGATLQVRNRTTGGTHVSCKVKLPQP